MAGRVRHRAALPVAAALLWGGGRGGETMLKLAGRLACVMLLLTGCAEGINLDRTKDDDLAVMGWDHRPEATRWTGATMAAVASHDSVLASNVPGDIAVWCPAYAKNDLAQRRAFWAGAISALAEVESDWNPEITGGAGRYIGLLQISTLTASANGCAATTAIQLKDGSANLACAVAIMARQVARDGVVAGDGRRGLGRDWGPLNDPATRANLSGWTARQSYCR